MRVRESFRYMNSTKNALWKKKENDSEGPAFLLNCL